MGMKGKMLYAVGVCFFAVAFLSGAVVSETPQNISLNEAVAESGWPSLEADPGYQDLSYAGPENQSLSLNSEYAPAPMAQPAQPAMAPPPDEAIWMAEGADTADAAVIEDDPVSGLGITVTGDWVSKYMFRGFDVYDDSAAWQPSVDVELWNTGLHLNWWASYAASDRSKVPGGEPDFTDIDKGETPEPPISSSSSFDREELDEHDYTIYWLGDIRDCVDVELGMIYYDFFRNDTDKLDFWEWYGVFTLSKMPLSPYFGAYYGTPKRRANGGEGWMTTLGVSHSCDLGNLSICGDGPVTLDLLADVWYNGGEFVDGVGTGWSHATFGGGVTFPLSDSLSFTPGVYYQLSMEDSINDEDEWWASLSLEYSW